MRVTFFIFSIELLYISAVVGSSVFVTTPSGRLQGTVVTVDNKTVHQYRKIPFAKAPVGDLRLQKPVPYGKWNNTLNATRFGPSCLQILSSRAQTLLSNTNVSEDCLFLNIYVPNNTSETDAKSVMIWIHGGAFLFGQATIYDASYLALYGDVIVVSINYRLGVLGFLTTGDDVSPGNYGLWDQKLAIQWVHDNIASFGGNPNSVTIFGESAGGMSVGLQAINPSNIGLFQRVIEESGTSMTPVAYTRNPEEFTDLVFKNLQCSNGTSNAERIECLRSKSAADILKADTTAQEQLPTRIGLGIGPVIDGEFIKDEPVKLLLNQNSDNLKFFKSLDYITGTVDSEGSLVLFFTGPKLQTEFNFNLSDGIPTRALCNTNGLSYLLAKENFKGNQNIKTAICKKYSSTNGLIEQSRRIVEFYGDTFFVSPAVQALNIHSTGNNKSSTYQFLFTRVQDTSSKDWFRGANHGAELFYIFGKGSNPNVDPMGHLSPDDVILSRDMQLYWANFAKTGNPNSNTSSLTHWPRYDEIKDKTAYIHLDVNTTTGQNLYEDRVNFWLHTIPSLISGSSGMESPSVYMPTTIILFLLYRLLQ